MHDESSRQDRFSPSCLMIIYSKGCVKVSKSKKKAGLHCEKMHPAFNYPVNTSLFNNYFKSILRVIQCLIYYKKFNSIGARFYLGGYRFTKQLISIQLSLFTT